MVYTNNTNRDIHMSKNLLKEAEETIYGPREDTYGPPNVNLTRIADQWSLYMKQKYDVDVKLDAEDVCWMMMDLKKCRQMHSPKRDNLLDSVGYIALIDRLSEGKNEGQVEKPYTLDTSALPTGWIAYNYNVIKELDDDTVIELRALSKGHVNNYFDNFYYHQSLAKECKNERVVRIGSVIVDSFRILKIPN